MATHAQGQGRATLRKESHGKVLAEWEQFALKDLLNLKQLMPTLVEKKVVPERAVSTLAKDTKRFLGFLKVKPVDHFVLFLEALAESFPESTDHVKLVSLMSNSLESLNVPQGSETFKRIQRVIEATKQQTEPVSEESSVISLTSQDAAQLQVSPTQVMGRPPLQTVTTSSPETGQFQSSLPSIPRPPEGFIRPARSQHFRREKGGTFYCPAHDVMISIPPFASPLSIPEFTVTMTAYIQGPFKIPDDIELCMAVIWLGVDQQFTFEEEVTLILPHCAILEDKRDFVFLRASEDPTSDTYDFTEELKANFSDGYHAVVLLDHFCAVTGGLKGKGSSRQRRRTGSKGRVRKRTARQQSLTRTNTPELVKQTTPELLNRLTSTSSAIVSPQSSLASTTHSFEDSFDSGATRQPQASVEGSTLYGHGLPTQSQSHSYSQVADQVGEESDSPYRPNPHPSQTGAPLGLSASNAESACNLSGGQSANPPPSQPTECNPSSQGDQRAYSLLRQEAFDEGSGHGTLTMQQSSGEGNSSYSLLIMAMCTVQQEEGKWEVTFLASCSHPTGMLALREACERLRGLGTTCHRQLFRAVSENLAFEPSEWKDGGWSAKTVSNARILVDAIYTVSEELVQQMCQLGIYPPRVTYQVDGTSGCLELQIFIKGADVGGEDLFFRLNLKSHLPTGTASSRKLQTWSELYTESGGVPETLSSNCHTPALLLDPEKPDHIKLLADLSFQLTSSDLRGLSDHLGINGPQLDRITMAAPKDLVEQIFQVLLYWVASQQYPSTASYDGLLTVLQTLGISGVDVVSHGKQVLAIDPRLDGHVIDDNVVLTVGMKLGPIWKFVGRFLGLSDTAIDQTEQAELHDNRGQPFQMLHRWKREGGNEATYGALLRAVHRVFEHEPRKICGAHTFISEHLHNLAQVSA